MFIKAITLENFRNYSNEKIEFSTDTNIIFGNNAQGKTNVLEAIFACGFGKSHRSSNEKDMIKFGEDFTHISMDFSADGRDQNISILLPQVGKGKKAIKVNNVSIKKLSQLVGRFNIVMFSPEDLEIIKKSPDVRRKFLDSFICPIRPIFLTLLSSYKKLIDQKTSLLKQIKNGVCSDDTLFVWNSKIATVSVQIMAYRRKFVSELERQAKILHSQIAKEVFAMEYESHFEKYIDKTSKNPEVDILALLQANSSKEVAAGRCLYGVHRDDLRITLDGNDTRAFASQGQQRSCVLSLKLASAECIFEDLGAYPVMLLDDIMSELDSSRREFLASKISGKQIIITCNDKEIYNNQQHVKFIKVDNGFAKTQD